jgi:hypothetical protein
MYSATIQTQRLALTGPIAFIKIPIAPVEIAFMVLSVVLTTNHQFMS